MEAENTKQWQCTELRVVPFFWVNILGTLYRISVRLLNIQNLRKRTNMKKNRKKQNEGEHHTKEMVHPENQTS